MVATTASAQPVQQPARHPIAKRSCTGCAHLPVCTVYRALTQLLEKWTDQTRPFEAADVANVCTTFYPASVANTLNGA
jgi:hypothetical protein